MYSSVKCGVHENQFKRGWDGIFVEYMCVIIYWLLVMLVLGWQKPLWSLKLYIRIRVRSMLPMKRMHESDMFARMQDVVILLEGNGREYEGGWCSSTL